MSVRAPCGLIVLLATSVATAQPEPEPPAPPDVPEPAEPAPEPEPPPEAPSEPPAAPPPAPTETAPPIVEPAPSYPIVRHPVPPLPPEPRPEDRFTMKLWASGAIRAIMDTPVFAFEGDIAFGARHPRKPWYFYGAVGGAAGETDLGIGVYRWWLGASIEHAWDIIRVGVMPQLSMLIVSRVTNAPDLAAFCIGADSTFSVDLVRGDDHHALFFALRLGAALIVPEAPYWGASAGLGYRY